MKYTKYIINKLIFDNYIYIISYITYFLTIHYIFKFHSIPTSPHITNNKMTTTSTLNSRLTVTKSTAQ
jgi:hypothetical protein